MTNPFLQPPFVLPSLNQATVGAVPGVAVDDDVLGRRGGELLSARALRALIRADAAALAIDPADPDPIARLNACFWSFQRPVRAAAGATAQRYGRRLGYLLAALQLGAPASRAARPDWDDVHWAYWAALRHVYLGGGLVAGAMAQHVLHGARAVLKAAGLRRTALALLPEPAYAALIGLARAARPPDPAMLVFDFGQTHIKRAVAVLDGGSVTALQPWTELTAPCGDPYVIDDSPPAARACLDEMVAVVADMWHTVRARRPLAPRVGIAVAAYLNDGQPRAEDRYCYGRLGRLSSNLRRLLADELAVALGEPVEVVLQHDGSAAAAVVAGRPRAAVIMLGTALGIGFAPEAGDWRPLAAALQPA